MTIREGSAVGAPSISEIDILWVTAGLGCDGDTIAMTAATQPSIEDIVRGGIPWIPKVNFHNPFLAIENGDEFLRPFHLGAEGKLAPFILVVEGSIPNENNKKEGYWASMGTDQKLSLIHIFLIVLLGGIAVLLKYYGIMATDPGAPGYQSVLSMLTAAVTGKGIFYDLTMFSVLLVLCLSANTSFADFPRLCRMIARDDYLPHSLTTRGRRLVFSQGIWALAIFAALLLILFGGVTDRLIPLFAVGAFMAFTLSQAGMVGHWWKTDSGAEKWRNIFFNGLGAVATGITVMIIVVAKFVEGAWVVVLLLPAVLLFMGRIRHHYQLVEEETVLKGGGVVLETVLTPPIVIVPVERWSAATEKALQFAMTLSPDVEAVHVTCESDENNPPWEWAGGQRPEGARIPKLVTLPSPYRLVVHPILDYITKVEKENPERTIACLLYTSRCV